MKFDIEACRSALATVVIESKRSSNTYPSLKKAIVPASEAACYRILALLGIDLENDYQRQVAIIVLNQLAIRKTKSASDLKSDKKFASQLKAASLNNSSELRFVGLLSASTELDFLKKLKNPLSQLSNKGLDFDLAEFWSDLMSYHYDPERIQRKWANLFYRYEKNETEGEG